MADIGLKVVEGVASNLAPFQQPSKRNIGLLMERQRGRENYPYLISSLAEDRLYFGGVENNKYGAIVTRNLFRNTQGFPARIYGVRIVGAGSTASTGTISIPGSPAVTLDITAGYQGFEDKGEWGDDLSVVFYSYNYKTRNKFVLEVIYNSKIVETYEYATCAEIQVAVNTSSNYVFVEFSGEPANNVVNVSGTGTITTVTAVVPETLATATLTVIAAGTAGNIITILRGVTTLGTYTVQTGDTQADVAQALAAAISSGTHGYTAVDSTNDVDVTAPTGSGATINGLSLTATATGTANVGPNTTFSGGVAEVPSAPSINVSGSGTSFTTQLIAGSILYDEDGNLIGEVATITNNTALVLSSVAQQSLSGQPFIYSLYGSISEDLTGGTYVAPTETDFYPVPDPIDPQGLACFDGVDVQLIAVTENNTLTMAVQGRDYCASRRDAVFIANLPYNANQTVVQNYANALQSNTSSFIAGYNAWVKTSDEAGSYVWVPALGCVLGAAYIRVPALQGDFIHIPPAGYDSAFVDIIDVTPNRVSQDRLNLLTRDFTVNSIVFQQGRGFFVMTSRTYSTNSLYHSVHIRMQTGFYVRVLTNNLGWSIQRPNTPELKKELRTACYAYFKNEYDNGALERSVSFEEACEIICDLSNNPVSQDRKQLNLDINWIPTETTEAIRISLNRNDGSLIAKLTE